MRYPGSEIHRSICQQTARIHGTHREAYIYIQVWQHFLQFYSRFPCQQQEIPVQYQLISHNADLFWEQKRDYNATRHPVCEIKNTFDINLAKIHLRVRADSSAGAKLIIHCLVNHAT